MKVDYFLAPYTKIDSKWVKDLNVRQESIKILEENTGSNLFNLSHSNFLQDAFPKARETKAKMNYWDFIRIKSFCTAKETVNKTKMQPTEWEKIFTNDISDKGLVSKIYKTYQTQHPKNQKKTSQDMGRKHEQIFLQRRQMANRHMKKYSTSLGIGK